MPPADEAGQLADYIIGAGKYENSNFWVATVLSVSADNPPNVTIGYRLAELPSAYLSSYTPTVGHRVICAKYDANLPIILGRVVHP
ncbi:hypothetical protein SAMN03159343_0253 [Klenkia marina]|uniref:Uncharacterized protein n=1 Tax=Klenkia marina TaxID=1960309 RepID=A0A1G4X9R6_9ACTN|nr:hypothetical protein [Klenkia marina]SCX37963.1 hypothetical protein SAMN03159343_0253 [Klenkia marina]